MSPRKPYLPPIPDSPPSTSPAVRASMIGNRAIQTRPETVLQEALNDLGLDYFVTRPSLQGKPDIVFEKEKVAVFVHGCYWHRCPYCSPHFPATNQAYWSAKFARNKARDRWVARELREEGWRVVVVWECKMKKNPKGQAKRVRGWVLAREAHSSKDTVNLYFSANIV